MPCLLVDIAELDNEMLPYIKEHFEKFFMNVMSFEINSSTLWYGDRTSYGPGELGKPRDEKYYDEYKVVYKKVFSDLNIPILYNVNFGNSLPGCIIPYDTETIIDYMETI